MRQAVVLTLVMMILVTQPSGAQTSTQSSGQPADPMASMWDPQQMIERSVKQATRSYNLTPEQEQYARRLTVEGVTAFLDKHELEMRTLMGEAMKARLSGQAPTPEQVKAWADRAAPLFEEGKRAIIEGNRQFREVLSDEQRVKFDADQKIIENQFSRTNETLTRWQQGGFDPAADWDSRKNPLAPDTRQARPELDRFERYARRFIENYGLDSAQSSQVMAIVAENRKRAEEYWFSHKTDIQTVRDRVQALAHDPKDRPKYLEATKQLAEINKPVNALYDEMRQRLEQIPNDAQRKAYQAQTQARRDAWREKMRDRGSETTTGPASQISASQQTAIDNLNEDRPVAPRRPATTRSATTRPATTQPVATRPAATQPAATQPAATRPVVTRPAP